MWAVAASGVLLVKCRATSLAREARPLHAAESAEWPDHGLATVVTAEVHLNRTGLKLRFLPAMSVNSERALVNHSSAAVSIMLVLGVVVLSVRRRGSIVVSR